MRPANNLSHIQIFYKRLLTFARAFSCVQTFDAHAKAFARARSGFARARDRQVLSGAALESGLIKFGLSLQLTQTL